MTTNINEVRHQLYRASIGYKVEKCPVCLGDCEVMDNRHSDNPIWIDCRRCRGIGYITENKESK